MLLLSILFPLLLFPLLLLLLLLRVNIITIAVSISEVTVAAIGSHPAMAAFRAGVLVQQHADSLRIENTAQKKCLQVQE